MHLFTLIALSAVTTLAQTTCVVQPQDNGADDAPAILEAFSECGQGGHVVFMNSTYNIKSVMNTTGLNDCQIDIHGTLLWDTNLEYWLNNSYPLGYQNQTSVWYLGGRNISVNGFGYGTLDGNGQAWYDLVQGISNYPNRPMGLTIWETYNSVFEGLRFVQSQMWTMTVKNSQNVLLQDIYVNSTSSSKAPARNTDGANTLYADRITFRRWIVDNGDDSIAIKANSSNILIQDSTFHTGLGVAIGSIGQYDGVYEHITDVVAENIRCVNTWYAGYVKTWTGIAKGYPPNGGGGGIGVVQNIEIFWRNFTLDRVSHSVLNIDQCTSFNSQSGDCDTSLLQISNVTWQNMTGSIRTGGIASLQCSAAAPCQNVTIEDFHVTVPGGAAGTYLCSNVEGAVGFNCTGSV